MNYIISYDLKNSYNRKQLSDYLKSYGFIRIQKSVFWGDIQEKFLKKYISTLKTFLELKDDSILICPVNTKDLKNSSFIGYNFFINKKDNFKIL